MVDTVQKLISATAWEMQPFKAYGPFHLTFTVAGFALCAFLAWRLRKLGDKGSKYLIFGVGLFLALTEVYKQMFYRICLWDGEYDWGIFPFHLCSVPMYLCIIAPFLKEGKLQKAMHSFMGCYNLLGGAISFAEPSGLIHNYWTLTLHAFIWHMLLVFVGLYLCFSGRAGREKSDYLAATKMFLLLCMVAFGLNLAFRELSGGAVNAFFIGPSDSPIIVFETISEYFGWYVSTAIYIPVVCFGAYIMFRLFGTRDAFGIKIKEHA